MSTIAKDDRLGPAADDIYEMLITAHANLSPEQSAELNMRLVLLLANMVGDADHIRDAIEAARNAG